MLLAKSCKQAHHAKKGTIQLGTLQHYREIENEHLIDQEEGTIRFNLKLENFTIDCKTINTLFGNTINWGFSKGVNYPGRWTATLYDTHMSTKDDYVTFHYTTASVQIEACNAFIFCVSEVNSISECSEIFPNYDDSWHIKPASTNEFCRRISHLIHQKIITSRQANEHIIPPEIPLETIRVMSRHHPVRYIPRDIHITERNVPSIKELISHYEFIEFLKPETPFKREKEYRLQFLILSGMNAVQPCVKTILIDSTKLMDLIF